VEFESNAVVSGRASAARVIGCDKHHVLYVRKFLMENLPHYMQFPVEAVLVVIQKVWREEIRCRELDIISVTDCRDYLLKFAFEYFS
jgi:hypothetical protein